MRKIEMNCMDLTGASSEYIIQDVMKAESYRPSEVYSGYVASVRKAWYIRSLLFIKDALTSLFLIIIMFFGFLFLAYSIFLGLGSLFEYAVVNFL